MPSHKDQRARAVESSSGQSRADGVFAEVDGKPSPGAQAVIDALSRIAASRDDPTPRKQTVRLIDLERRARFGRCGFGAL